MKNHLFIFALTLGFTPFFGCQTTTDKMESALEYARDTNESLSKNPEDGMKVSNGDEWRVFKHETKAKIMKNNLRIEELRERRAGSGKVFDNLYSARIDELQKNNQDLRDRLDNYDKNGGDWEQFKKEFNEDLDELGKALDGFAENDE